MKTAGCPSKHLDIERHFKGALRHSLFYHNVAEEEEESQVFDSPACDSDGEATIAQYYRKSPNTPPVVSHCNCCVCLSFSPCHRLTILHRFSPASPSFLGAFVRPPQPRQIHHPALVLRDFPAFSRSCVHPSSSPSAVHPSSLARPPSPDVFSSFFFPLIFSASSCHLASKPSCTSVCFRAVSSTKRASTFSCSSNGFRACSSISERIFAR